MCDSEEKQFIREQDADQNTATQLPPDERIEVPCIWVIEVFPPSLIDNLRIGAERLGWDKQYTFLNDDFVATIQGMRESARGGGWLNLGFITSPTQKTFPFARRQAQLPNGIESIHVTLVQEMPSITMLCCCFIIDPDNTRLLEIPLQETFATKKEPISGGILYRSVQEQKKDAVETMRAYLHNLCAGWVIEHFPGYFAAGEGEKSIPTCELILFEKATVFEKRKNAIDLDYVDMLGPRVGASVWKSDELENLYLRFDERDARASRRFTLEGNKNLVFESKDLSMYGKEKTDRIVGRLHDFDRTLVRWTLNLISNRLISELANLRDTYGMLDVDSNTVSIDARRLDTDFNLVQRVALPFVYDVRRFANNERQFSHDVCVFKARPYHREQDFFLFQNIREKLLSDALHLEEAEKQIRAVADHVARFVTAASNEHLAETNLALQSRILWMTLVMLLLTAVTAIEPLKRLLID